MSSTPILVVDDDSSILELIAQVLIDEGFSVITAGDGRSAVALARSRLPKLILLDLMMPGMNGWQVVTALQATPQTGAIPVILLSARRDLAATATDLGATAYLEKPFDLDDLVQHVQLYAERDEHSSEREN